jgi:mono/diheme cytochrome c family protein
MKSEKRPLVTRGVETEPGVGPGEIPIIFFGILAGLVFLGLLYLDKYAGGFNSMVYRPYESYKQISDAQPRDPEMQRKLHGMALYDAACKLCHQPNGLGTPGTFPPLDGSEWVNGPVPRLARIPMHGLAGPITIKGEKWNSAMPNAGGAFSDEDLADLLTYVRGAWGNKSPAVDPAEVKKARAKDGGRGQPWSEAELLKIPEKE